jgi:hypothetical protein
MSVIYFWFNNDPPYIQCDGGQSIKNWQGKSDVLECPNTFGKHGSYTRGLKDIKKLQMDAQNNNWYIHEWGDDENDGMHFCPDCKENIK